MDRSLFPAPHGLSQGITSFIASCCQGIHQTPFSRLIRSSERRTPEGGCTGHAAGSSRALSPDPEVVLSLRAPRRRALAVSVLDLDSTPAPCGPFRRRTDARGARPLAGAKGAGFVSLSTMSNVPWDGRAHPRMRPAIPPDRDAAPRGGDGGAYRDRTGDLLNANQALSQLS